MKRISISHMAASLSVLALLVLFSSGRACAEESRGSPTLALITPHCGASAGAAQTGDDSLVVTQFEGAVCPRPDLLATLQHIDKLAQKLMPGLPPAWRESLAAQQAAFPQTVNNCPAGKPALEQCLADSINQRLKDLEDLQASIKLPARPCTPSEVSILDGHDGDAGMSHQFAAYLFRYNGSGRCQISGYPAMEVTGANGQPQPSLAVYSGKTYFTQMTGAPLPVTLSAANRSAWFGVETASACERPSSLNVKIALPKSATWIRTLSFPDANCAVTITPVSAMSTLHALLQ